MSNNNLNIDATFGYPSVDFSKDVDNPILLTLKADDVLEDVDRAPVDICLCIDVSSSMDSSNKLKLAKASAILLLENLKETDRLSLIAYSNTIDFSCIFRTLEPNVKKSLIDTISKLRASGATNMSNAFIEAFSMFSEINPDEDRVKRIIFLTDGCPTSGETNSDRLVELVSNKPKNVLVTTMGYGTPSDSNQYSMSMSGLNTVLLQAMSDAGKGNYYYMSDAESCRNAFANELAGLLSIVAQDVEITIKANTERLRLQGTKEDVDMDGDETVMTLNIPDIISGETRYLLIEASTLKQDKAWARPANVGLIEIKFKSPVTAMSVDHVFNLKMDFVIADNAATELHEEVDTQIKLLDALSKQKQAEEAVKKGAFYQAKDIMKSVVDGLADIGTERGVAMRSAVMDSVETYGDRESYTSGSNVVGATFRSMSKGRSAGGTMDAAFTSSAQSKMQSNFANSGAFDDIVDHDKLQDLKNDVDLGKVDFASINSGVVNAVDLDSEDLTAQTNLKNKFSRKSRTHRI